METTQIPISIYTEATPNPEALKFVANKMLVAGNSAHFENVEQAALSPLATQLFVFPFVKEVFIMNNFVTVTKQPDQDWYEIMHEVRDFLRNFIESDQPIIDEAYFAEQKTAKPVAEGAQGEIEQKIISILDTYVKPAVEMDGGAIQFISFEDGKVSLLLQGSCSGCPSSTVTLKQGIEGMMKRMIPEVEEVVAVAG
ncbi:MAG: NifU family protein [Saprospiraceae bacterium]|nr:NifU family protein [Saprospiraceae bacterium]